MNAIELRWHDLKTEPPPLGRPVIMFPRISDVGHMFGNDFWTTSNPEYARLHALEQGYTSWFPIPEHPDEVAVEAKCEEFRREEANPQRQFHKGFQRAAENIVEALEQLVPDRAAVAQCIRDRFVHHGRKNDRMSDE